MDDFFKWMPLIVLLLNLLILWIGWSVKRGLVTKEEHSRLTDRVNTIESRLSGVPNAASIHELALTIERLRGDLKALASDMKGMGNLVERLDKVVTRHEQIFTSAARP